jgi:type VI secretion system protein ImpC
VEVLEDEENPGYYVGKFFLKPHFQLEGMDIGMSLVSKLPTKK